MEMDIRSVLLQMRVTHAMQTANLIDQANAIFNLEDLMKQNEREEQSRKRHSRKKIEKEMAVTNLY